MPVFEYFRRSDSFSASRETWRSEIFRLEEETVELESSERFELEKEKFEHCPTLPCCKLGMLTMEQESESFTEVLGKDCEGAENESEDDDVDDANDDDDGDGDDDDDDDGAEDFGLLVHERGSVAVNVEGVEEGEEH